MVVNRISFQTACDCHFFCLAFESGKIDKKDEILFFCFVRKFIPEQETKLNRLTLKERKRRVNMVVLVKERKRESHLQR